PSWSPILNNAVEVTTEGDVAIIDTRGLGTTNVLINVALTNSADLDASHNYFILPVEINYWSGAAWTGANSGDGDGDASTGGTAFGVRYLSTNNGYLNFTVDGDEVYEISIPTGGSIFAVNTTTLGPSCLISTTPA